MRQVAAIDVGGTKILGAIVNEKGKVLIEKRVPSDFEKGGLHIMNVIFELIDEFKKTYTIDAIGIGIGGRVDNINGVINWGVKKVPNFFGLKVKELTEEKYKVPCAVDNDVKVAGYGEQWKGAGKDVDSYVCITLGTGVGGAIRIHGDMLHGKHFSGGELGHIILHPHGRQCTCGFKGCVEQYLSGTALVNIYNERSNNKVKTGYEFFEKIKDKEVLALEVLDEFVDDLYTLIISMCNTYDPDKIIIGGGLIDTKEYWWDKLMNKIDNSPINQVFEPIVVPAVLGNKAGYYGSAYLALSLLK